MLSLTSSKPKKTVTCSPRPRICWCSFNLELIEITHNIPRGSKADGETQLEDNKPLKYLNLIWFFWTNLAYWRFDLSWFNPVRDSKIHKTGYHCNTQYTAYTTAPPHPLALILSWDSVPSPHSLAADGTWAVNLTEHGKKRVEGEMDVEWAGPQMCKGGPKGLLGNEIPISLWLCRCSSHLQPSCFIMYQCDT